MKPMKPFRKVFSLVLALALCAFAFTAFAESIYTTGMTGVGTESPFKAVYETVNPSVVGIEISTQMRVYNGRIQTTSSFVGSGVVISDDGYVLTNYHVVQSAEAVFIVVDGESFPAEYIAGDEASDIAVLKCEELNLPAAVLGDSDALSVGDWALVVGNPLGERFANTLTVGVISGLDRNVQSSSRTGRSTSTSMIQTNAAINSGNSGGGLFNINGELVGITSMKLSSSGYFGGASIEGIGLAIPINTIKGIIDDLIEYGKVIYPRIGVSISEINSRTLEPTEDMLPAGILITKFDEEESPAREAGIEAYDIIIEADGERITASTQLQSIVRGHEVGETVSIKVYRIPGLMSLRSDDKIPEGEYLTFDVEVRILDADKE